MTLRVEHIKTPNYLIDIFWPGGEIAILGQETERARARRFMIKWVLDRGVGATCTLTKTVLGKSAIILEHGHVVEGRNHAGPVYKRLKS